MELMISVLFYDRNMEMLANIEVFSIFVDLCSRSVSTKYIFYISNVFMDPRIFTLLILYFLKGFLVSAQVNILGRVVDQISGKGLPHVRISFEGQSLTGYTDEGGYFNMGNYKLKTAVLNLEMKGYKKRRIPLRLDLTMKEIDLGSVAMSRLDEMIVIDDWVELSQDDIDSNNGEAENISGILSAGKDLFSRTAAYDFGSNFFRPRFLGSEHTNVMLNGVSMNKVYSGKPVWGNWGGLNDALRQQERYAPMQSSPFSIGGLSEGVNMMTNASKQKKGIKLSMAMANKSYQSRIMATYTSGLTNKDWAYMLSASLRFADEGYRKGTNYKAYSFLASIDKRFGTRHSLNATFIYAFIQKGKSSPLTQEVFELKNTAYNSYWGHQQDKKRNSREKKILEPIFQLNYQYNVNEKTSIHSHFTYQFGSIASSRLDYSGVKYLQDSQTFIGGGLNPDPSYYQKLPSYFLRVPSNPDFGRAYLAEKKFREEGQINWEQMYAENTNPSAENNSIYVLYNDHQDSRFWSLNCGFSTILNNNFSMDGAVSITGNTSENYALMLDLLGGSGYLDVDSFADNFTNAQNNLQHTNRIVQQNEKFRYNYQLMAKEIKGFIQTSYRSKKSDAFIGMAFSSTSYLRNGLYENGFHPDEASLGKSKVASFHLPAIKAGLAHKFSGRHVLVLNSNYLYRAPVMNYSFSNVRVSNDLVDELKPLHMMGIDLKYSWRHPKFNATLSIYYLKINDGSKVSFYYADGLTGLENSGSGAFVQEVLTSVDKQNTGLELSIEIPVFINLKLKAVAAIGSSIYASNPELYITSNTLEGALNLGKSFLRGYYATGSPQHLFSVGFEYSSPKYWWFSTSINYFDKSFVAAAPITRTKNFFLDTDGLPIHNIDTALAKELLIQEPLKSYMNLNMVGGKSWKVKDMYIGFFASINNLTNNLYKTGGFEQSRTANYLTLKEDKLRSKPLFGPKYWFASGTTFFTSFYIRL